MVAYTPEVVKAHAFREISRDLTKPEEIFREAIANSLDAYAERIWLRTTVEERRGSDKVIIDLCDDGIGMDTARVRAFFNLSDSVKPTSAPSGKAVRRMTGYKGGSCKTPFSGAQTRIRGRTDRNQSVKLVLFCKRLKGHGTKIYYNNGDCEDHRRGGYRVADGVVYGKETIHASERNRPVIRKVSRRRERSVFLQVERLADAAAKGEFYDIGLSCGHTR